LRRQESSGKDTLFTSLKEVRLVTRIRNPFSSKRDFCPVLVVGGSDVYSDAPALTSMAALRVGVGLAVVAAPMSVASSCHKLRSEYRTGLKFA
jgi:NAD(P)H-hydrate repair Nnr-like enzyme with NAD(P)H-hydrate dehydratase domain